MNYCAAFLCGILFVLQNSLGLEYNRQQRQNANTDFLLHEGGLQASGPNKDYVATQTSSSQSQTYGNQNGGRRDYVAQFPSSNYMNTGPQRNPQSSNGKRDYVTAQFPTLKPLQQNIQSSGGNNNNQNTGNYADEFPALSPPSTPQSHTSLSSYMNTGQRNNAQSSNGKRDYVAPQFPTLKPSQQNIQSSGGNKNNQNTGNYAAQFPALGPQSTSQSHTTSPSNMNSGHQNNAQSSDGRRDYVAPQFPTLKPVQQNNQPVGGKVKDLINFYDSKSNQGSQSYSSILQGKNGQSSTATLPSTRYTQPVTQSTLIHTPKPMSFSSIVPNNKPSTYSTVTTPKPTTRIPSTPTSRPGTPVLPSSIVNNNRGNSNSNSVSDAELEALSEELLRKDSNNAARYITINYQEKTTSQSKEDKAPLPLLTISPEVWNIPTIQKFVPLLDNYERDTLVNEYVTPQERNEENAFMDAVMSTTVMRHLMTYLKNKGYVTPDPKQQRDFLKQLWFSLYSRGKGKISSSGFEHVFVSEIKDGDVKGLHNWIYFAREEAANRINYLGYLKYAELSDKGVVMKFHFNQQGVDKPVNSLFIGTSPELEMALYTLCFVTRADNDCKLKLANKDVNIITHTYRYRSKNLIGSAFPQI